MKMLVTGGLGFIGAAFVRAVLRTGDHEVVNLDADTYAADRRRLEGISGPYRLEVVDIADATTKDLIRNEAPDVIVHLAAESHVTRSETQGDRFFRTNVEGTRNVLEAARATDVALFVHVSTDEVYGPCAGDAFREDDKLPGEGAASSPYARSKAVADDLARACIGELPVTVVRPSNCIGPYQHPEKAVARWITRALRGEPIPVWGDGGQVRDWMFVDDLCSALLLIVSRRLSGEVFNIAPEGTQITNLEMATLVARAAGRDASDVYLTAYDRPAHDRRYAIDAARMRAAGWEPAHDLTVAVEKTVSWYDSHRAWWQGLVDEAESLYPDAQQRGDQPAGR
ncbi:MAG: NAD-dependent epimerase/dehydratase family protein [Actinomycetota bacterium]|nr:NAD-dependent epimerase/dehydratase family protein [Actinomycetota bacterium]